jgi:cytochrome c-type biogenesis protein CcmH/NrfG
MRGIAGAAVLIVAAVLATGRVSAQSASIELADKYARGEYLEVAEAAEAAAGADDLAFAARALLAHCITGAEEPDAAVIDRAWKDAEAALELDPGHEEGQLQLAIALSLKSRGMDALDAWNKGYGDKGRTLATDVLKSDPANYYAHGFLAVWNVEVRRRGGTLGATFMGASLKDGRKHYAEAVRLAPDDVGIHWQYGRALVALNVKEYGEEAARALDRAVSSLASDHVEQVMQERARKLSEVLKNDVKAAQRLARKML